jgi:hypothetical protein
LNSIKQQLPSWQRNIVVGANLTRWITGSN